MIDDRLDEAMSFLRSILGGLCEPGDSEKLDISHAWNGDHFLRFLVLGPGSSMPYLLGREGKNAEAVRVLMRGWAGAQHWPVAIDIRVDSL